MQVPGGDFQEAACLADLTTKGTQETGHTNSEDWAGLNAKETDNPSGVSGLQIDGYFPDDSSTNNEHDYDSQFVLRLPAAMCSAVDPFLLLACTRSYLINRNEGEQYTSADVENDVFGLLEASCSLEGRRRQSGGYL